MDSTAGPAAAPRMFQVALAPLSRRLFTYPALLWYPLWAQLSDAGPPRTAAPAWQVWSKGHSQSHVGRTAVSCVPSAKRTKVLAVVKGPDPSLYRSVAWLVRSVSQPPDTRVLYLGTDSRRSMALTVGLSSKLPEGEY